MNEEPKPAKEFIRLRYPHLGPIEVEIWNEFLRKTDLKFIRIDYDVRVGMAKIPPYYYERYRYLKKMAEVDPKYKEELRVVEATIKSFEALTKLRIDAVGETKDAIWIFEVKPRAGRSALGQLLSYAYWYEKQYKPRKVIKLAVVCTAVDTNLIPLYDKYGIYIFNVREM